MSMTRFAATLAPVVLAASAARAAAQQIVTPLHKTASGGAVPTDGNATLWLALAAVAMIASLYAVHWSIFRRK